MSSPPAAPPAPAQATGSGEPNWREQNKRKQNWYHGQGANNSKKQHTDLFYEGIIGVLVTCNLREVEALRETYSLLNEYEEKLGAEAAAAADSTSAKSDVVDIESELQKEIAQLKNPTAKKFRQIQTKCKNIIFVQILAPLDPLQLVLQILKDIEKEGKGKARFANRFIPVQRTCKATIELVEQAVQGLLGEESSEESSFQVQVKIRNNNELKRMDFVDSVAKVVKKARPQWKVDFEEPAITVNIDIMIRVCCISLLPDYNKLKKYNLIEYAAQFKPSEQAEGDKAEAAAETE